MIKSLELKESQLNNILDKLKKHKITKYSVTIVVFFLMVLFSQSTIIKLINITISSSQADLKESIDSIIPPHMNIDQALTQEIMLTSWNINRREPVLFSKDMKKRNPNSQYDGLSFGEMAFASASDPTFFSAAKLNYKNGD